MNTRALSSSSSSCDYASSRSACGLGMVMTRVERTGSQGGRSAGPLQGNSSPSSISPTGRPKSASGSSSSYSSSNSRRPTCSPSKYVKDDSSVSGRVRLVVRLRPQNAKKLIADADFADCVELQPEVLPNNLVPMHELEAKVDEYAREVQAGLDEEGSVKKVTWLDRSHYTAFLCGHFGESTTLNNRTDALLQLSEPLPNLTDTSFVSGQECLLPNVTPHTTNSTLLTSCTTLNEEKPMPEMHLKTITVTTVSQ